MIHFYGSPMSSSGRTHWMLEEIGVPYEYHRVNLREKGALPAEFLAASPGRNVPAIDDDGFRLTESIAVNFYLAEKYLPELMGRTQTDRARVYEWSLWAITNLQPELLAVMGFSRGGDAEAAKGRALALLALLEKALTGHDYLVGDAFGVADVNAGSVVNLARAVGLLGEEMPGVTAWVDRVRARPAYARAAAEA